MVDQSGKGFLGRPVRDYRWVNSQTLDAAWPSPNAESVLARTKIVFLVLNLTASWTSGIGSTVRSYTLPSLLLVSVCCPDPIVSFPSLGNNSIPTKTKNTKK